MVVITGVSESRCRPTRFRGATTIEFSLALILGVLPLVLGILQVAMLLAARNTVNWATFMAARQGALAGAEPGAMSRELARGLLPLYVPVNRGGVVAAERVAAAYTEALADVIRLDTLIVQNPSRGALERYGVLRQGKRVIPNDYIEHRPLAVQDANVLTISVVHCQPLVVPLVGPSLATALRLLNDDPRQSSCLEAGRAPIMARASVVMQTDVQGEGLR
jgi:TadE-like protein